MERRDLTADERKFTDYVKRIWDSKRRDLDLTQTTAADKLGIKQGAINQLLNGKIPITATRAVEFSVLLNEPLFKQHPILKKQLNTIGRFTIQEVTIPVMFALNRKTKAKIDILLPDTASVSCYAVQVDTDDLSPYAEAGAFLIVDPFTDLTENAKVFINTLEGENYVGKLLEYNSTSVKIKHLTSKKTTRIKLEDFNLCHSIVGTYDR